jgi:hypothetical protein
MGFKNYPLKPSWNKKASSRISNMSYNYSIGHPDKFLIINETRLDKSAQEPPATTIDKKNSVFDHNIRKFKQRLLTIDTEHSQINSSEIDQLNQNVPITAKEKLCVNSKSHHARTSKNAPMMNEVEFPAGAIGPESIPHSFQPHGDVQFAC